MSTPEFQKRKLVFSIISFLNDEIQSGKYEPDSVESLEVATQCLENVFSVSLTNPQDRSTLFSPKSLESLFSDALPTKAVTDADKKRAEALKNEGNELMKSEKFQEAVNKYSEAVSIDPQNAVYYSNRAAAYSKLGSHQDAIADCQFALRIDDKYSKAYGRMGLAYTELHDYAAAVSAYQTALTLDPNNESYKNNLKVAQELLDKSRADGTGGPTLGGIDLNSMAAGGGLSNVLSNPQFMNMATKLMSNPEIMNAFSAAMQGSGPGGPGGEGGPNMNSLLEMGQRLAEQIEREDPDKVEQLRRQFQNQGGDSGAGGSAGS